MNLPTEDNNVKYPWWVFEIDGVMWWLARSHEEAKSSYRTEVGEEPGDVAALSMEDMERLKFLDEGHDPTDWRQWECECGAKGDANCRWNGVCYEHHHGYPLGHVPMRCSTRRTYMQELENREATGIEGPGLFAQIKEL